MLRLNKPIMVFHMQKHINQYLIHINIFLWKKEIFGRSINWKMFQSKNKHQQSKGYSYLKTASYWK